MSSRRVVSALVALGLGAAGLALIDPAEAADPRCGRTNNSVRKLLGCVTLEGVLEHEEALQRIADGHGDTRASGTDGYDESVDYVEERLTRAGYVVTRQEFTFHAFAEVGPSVLRQTAPVPTDYVEGTDFGATPQSEPGDVTAAVTPVDLQLGPGNTSTSGCEAVDFAGFPVGNIALIQRGSCTFEIKAENAAAAGAVGVVFFNQGDTTAPDRNGIPAVTLGDGYTGGIPAVNATYARGVEWANTPGLRMRLFANVTPEAGDHREPPGRNPGRRCRQRGDGRRAPRLGPGRTRHQRQRLGVERPDRGRRADGQAPHEAAEQGEVRVVGLPRRPASSARRST